MLVELRNFCLVKQLDADWLEHITISSGIQGTFQHKQHATQGLPRELALLMAFWLHHGGQTIAYPDRSRAAAIDSIQLLLTQSIQDE